MLSAVFHILHCGQGDTILLNLNEKKWVLIDCNLPSVSSRNAFFEIVMRLGVNRLDLICLTHPHEDHYHGMRAVIEHFRREGRSIGAFCDSGISPRAIYGLMNLQESMESNPGEYVRLWELLSDIFDEGVEYIFAHERSTDLLIEGEGEAVRLIPIGPTPATVRSRIEAALRKGRLTGLAREELNLASVVLALRIRGEADFDGILTGDTDGRGINRAVEFYSAIDGKMGKTFCFDLVKVAHHGSLDSHKESLVVKCRKSNNSIAAISCGGNSSVLPDREVMRDFIENGWVLLLTTKRSGSKIQNYALELSDRSRTSYSHDVAIVWSETEGLNWGPPSSRVTEEELSDYGTALKVI